MANPIRIRLIPLPATGKLTRRLALEWLRDDLQGYQHVLVTAFASDDARERSAAALLALDLMLTVGACIDAIDGKRASRFATDGEELPGDDADAISDLARVLATQRLGHHSTGGPNERGYARLGAELVRRLELAQASSSEAA